MGRPRIRPVAVVLVLAACGLVYGGALLYAPVATVSRAREGQAAGLDALAYLERGNAARAAAIEWVNGRLGPSDVLLEAVGSIYSDGNYVSAASGVPTLLGWPAHQCQWRGAVDTCRDAGQTAQITERRAAVARIYTAGATEGALELARQQGVTHVYFGREERRQFGADVAARFICDECVELCQEIINAAWPLQFQSGEVTIVRVPR
jgi:uncharacterized membrane protein